MFASTPFNRCHLFGLALIMGAIPVVMGAASAVEAPPPGATGAIEAANLEVATFAAGCFWCVEKDFDKVPGVVETISGYTGGKTANPTYYEVGSGDTGHTEALEVRYDPAKVSYSQLLDHYWRHVDFTDGAGQFCDRGTQYRPAIFTHSDAQAKLAEASKADIAKRFGVAVKVEIVPAKTFTAAEDYHQDYYKKNPVKYRFYRAGCGRDSRIQLLWNTQAAH
ncbi:MAG: peptide-methionine (S)-S-oxide reductase MsrA [Hyphomicrobium sp.]|nr:peptide-methionine (S)-S-oxide reductase MsrA [Hyphomicrobium sp.]